MKEDPGIIWVAGVLIANDRDVPAPIVRQLLDIIEKLNTDAQTQEDHGQPPSIAVVSEIQTPCKE